MKIIYFSKARKYAPIQAYTLHSTHTLIHTHVIRCARDIRDTNLDYFNSIELR